MLTGEILCSLDLLYFGHLYLGEEWGATKKVGEQDGKTRRSQKKSNNANKTTNHFHSRPPRVRLVPTWRPPLDLQTLVIW